MVDKRVGGGRLYLKKGTVMDVAPGGVCEVKMDEGREVVTVGGRHCVERDTVGGVCLCIYVVWCERGMMCAVMYGVQGGRCVL